ncbi:MAG: glycosyltransferase [Leucobacter sp.]
MTVPPSIDVVIPVHTATRPIHRAVSSVLAAQSPGVRALVVCHNIDASEIATNLHGINDERLVLIEHRDGIHSPAGPLNAGVRAAEADYVTFLGSDDEFGIGVLDAWADELRGQQLHIGQLIADNGTHIFAPAPRAGRFEHLDPVKDLLNYRTAPVGTLVARALLTSSASPGFIEGVRTGEDIALGAFLWNTAQSITYSRYSDGYRIREDEHDRVSTELPALAVLLAPIDGLLAEPWVAGMSARARAALSAKLIRYQLLEPCRVLARAGRLSGADLQEALRALTALVEFSPSSLEYLPRRDAVPARRLLAGDLRAAEQRLAASGPGSLWERVVPGNPLRLFAPEGLICRAIRHPLISRALRP